jgi:hypothetical protein
MRKNMKKILKVVSMSAFLAINLFSGLPILHEDISPKCIEQIPANIDIDYGIMDCSKKEIQLEYFGSTTSGAMLSGSQTVGLA